MPFQFRKEAIEEDLNSNFPSQGQGNPPLYYSLSETVVPTYSINQVAEGSSLPTNLQTAYDFSTGQQFTTSNGSDTIISNTGFWQIQGAIGIPGGGTGTLAKISITDGVSTKPVYQIDDVNTTSDAPVIVPFSFVVYLRSGDSVVQSVTGVTFTINTTFRQIADINGNLVNPLGYSAA